MLSCDDPEEKSEEVQEEESITSKLQKRVDQLEREVSDLVDLCNVLIKSNNLKVDDAKIPTEKK